MKEHTRHIRPSDPCHLCECDYESGFCRDKAKYVMIDGWYGMHLFHYCEEHYSRWNKTRVDSWNYLRSQGR